MLNRIVLIIVSFAIAPSVFAFAPQPAQSPGRWNGFWSQYGASTDGPLSGSQSALHQKRWLILRGVDDDSNSDSDEVVRMMPWPLSFIPASPYLNNELAGDAGWDPLRFVKTREDLFFYREAEIKHARIAMLGSLGWPVSELYHNVLASALQLPNLLQDGKVPSILNGGIDNTYFLASLGGFFAVGATLEFELMRRKKETPESLRNFFDMWREDDWETPGNYQFDPLDLGRRLTNNDREGKKTLQTIEIFNGRMSMIANTGFVVQEAITGKPLVEETPQFFRFTAAGMDAVNSVLGGGTGSSWWIQEHPFFLDSLPSV